MKKCISLGILFLFIFSFNVYATSQSEEHAASQLKMLGILSGYEDGSLRLDNNILRSEVATIAIKIKNPSNNKIEGEFKSFLDVSEEYWAYQIISDAYNLDLIAGYPDNTFKPLNNITFAEVNAIMVNALGENKDLEGEWPMNYINKAMTLGIISKNDVRESDKIISRGEMAEIVWSTLLVQR